MADGARQTISHILGYASVKVLTNIASLISFPIITRLLSPGDYGLLALANVTILLLVAIGKAGVPKALVYYTAKNDENKKIIYISSIFSIVIITSFLYLFYFTFIFLFDYFFEIPRLFYWCVIVVILEILFLVYLNLLRVEGAIKKQNILSCSRNILISLSIVLALLYIKATVSIIFMVKIMIAFFFTVPVFSAIDFSYIVNNYKALPSHIRNLIYYGFPLIVLELSSIIMAMGDRYQIGLFLNQRDVGYYSVASNIAKYISDFIAQPFSLAIFPIYNHIFFKKGRDYTSQYLTHILTYYIVISIPIFALFSITSKQLIITLASSKYIESYLVLSPMLLGFLFFGGISIVASGLYIYKATSTIAKVSCSCAALNVMLNLILIPLFGYLGAAFATSLTFMIYFFIIFYYSRKLIEINIHISSIIKSIAATIIAASIFFRLNPVTFHGILTDYLLFFCIVLLVFLSLDKETRCYLKSFFV